jgi:hypothetical protein
MLFSPARGMHVNVTADGYLIQETIDLDGISYQRQSGTDSRWKVMPGPSTTFHNTGWDNRDPPGNLRVASWDRVGTEPAWHLTADDGYDWWIGVRRGYPLKMVHQGETGPTVYTFDRFNSSASIQLPSADRLSTKLAQGKVGDRLQLQSLQAQVTQVNPKHQAAARPHPGNHYVAAYLIITNTEPASVQFDGLLITTDRTGFRYADDSYLAPEPQLGAQEVDPGQSVQGWLSYEVPDGARGLTLRIPPPGEQSAVDYLFSIALGG